MSLEQVLNNKNKWIILSVKKTNLDLDSFQFNKIISLNDFIINKQLKTAKQHFHDLINIVMLHVLKEDVVIDSQVEELFNKHFNYSEINDIDKIFEWFLNLIHRHYEMLTDMLVDEFKLKKYKIHKVVNGWDITTYGLLISFEGVNQDVDSGNSN